MMLVVRLPRRGHWPQARFVIIKHTGFAAIRISRGISVILTLIYLMRCSRYLWSPRLQVLWFHMSGGKIEKRQISAQVSTAQTVSIDYKYEEELY